MSEKEQIKRALREASLYKTQGLLEESREKYLELLNYIRESQKFSTNQELIDAVEKKIKEVEKSIQEFEQGPKTLELSTQVQDLIKNLFTFSNTDEAAAVEGAVALAKFGQYERALEEFQSLLEKGIMPVVTAKNIIRCYLSMNTPEAAIEEFKKWHSQDTFPPEELANLRSFVKATLQKAGVEAELPEAGEILPAMPRAKTKRKKAQQMIIDISGVSIRFDGGPLKGQTVDFDVDFQSSNTVSIVISTNQKHVADCLEPGTRLEDMQCYSPITVFRSNGIVSRKATIKQGPRKGDYMIDITIEED